VVVCLSPATVARYEAAAGRGMLTARAAARTPDSGEETTSHRSERCFVDSFVTAAASHESPWGALSLAREFDYLRGRPDVVALTSDGELLVFEAKLERWKVALHQAYRNTTFSHRSYVLLPARAAKRAVRFSAEFARRGVSSRPKSARGQAGERPALEGRLFPILRQ
jgi:hypothetical protein